MESNERPVLDYAGPPSGKRPVRPMRDWVLLLWSGGVLCGCSLAIAVLWGIGRDWPLLIAVVLPLWAIGGICLMVITKRRLHPSPVADQRPNRIILAFAMAELSVIASICGIGIGGVYVRGASRRLSCQENLRSVGQALFIYAADNKGFLPPYLVTPLRLYKLDPSMLHCREAADPGPITIGPTTTDMDLIKAGVTDYVYLGDSSVKLDKVPNATDVPLVVEFPANHSDGLVLYADGHNSSCTRQETAEMMSEYLAQRRGQAGGAASRPAAP